MSMEEKEGGFTIAADDQVTVAHAVRMLLKTARATALPRWRQSGFRRSPGSEEPGTTMLRRSYNYDDDTVVAGDGEITDAGLLFLAYQRDVDEGFVPVQRRLDELDLLNQWTTPVGSAVFAIPPGCQEGGFIGDTLF